MADMITGISGRNIAILTAVAMTTAGGTKAAAMIAGKDGMITAGAGMTMDVAAGNLRSIPEITAV
jgi:hypothetical protein